MIAVVTILAVMAIYHALMLLFATAMCAFTLTGDLFDAFVFFELMGVIAYVLTGYKAEEPQAVHGAVSFSVLKGPGCTCAVRTRAAPRA
ncbi:hypothetical protein GCM10029978_070060 [Actinoallomurus acanthiterrae]